MSYDTVYHLTWSCPSTITRNPECAHEVRPSARFCEECGLRVLVSTDETIRDSLRRRNLTRESNGYLGEMRWYEYERDMKEISRECPGVLFHLRGRGERLEDIWDLFAEGGRIQKHMAVITRRTVPDADGWS